MRFRVALYGLFLEQNRLLKLQESGFAKSSLSQLMLVVYRIIAMAINFKQIAAWNYG